MTPSTTVTPEVDPDLGIYLGSVESSLLLLFYIQGYSTHKIRLHTRIPYIQDYPAYKATLHTRIPYIQGYPTSKAILQGYPTYKDTLHTRLPYIPGVGSQLSGVQLFSMILTIVS